ncbi:hypothetical protein KUCAC02_014952 [Chaenocephalus aceratus]|uniref:Uncharacterized protein n=1 Tax=Chaenocephalus aceratus TaxID=36190 RepID=A0ACB9WGD7_CHAAC|nr:hypothetical protein KUCAC02_014952 [Chaenocephalus aceratus]
MNRTDLVQRLSDVSSGTKAEPLPSLIQSVETMASVIELLLETLKDLSDQELQSFKRVLIEILPDRGYPDISPSWLMMRDRQDIVFYLVQDHSQHRLLEMTTEAFEKMNRLIWCRGCHKAAQDSKKKPRYFSWIWSSSPGRAQTVEQIIQIFGQQCVEITMEVLKDINRTDLRQRFTNLELKEMYSVDEHRPAESEGVSLTAPIAAMKEILLKTLKDLSDHELYRFQWFLQFTYFQKSISCIFHGYPYRTASALQLVDQMVETCGPQSVEAIDKKQIYGQQSMEVTTEILTKMKEDDYGTHEEDGMMRYMPAGPLIDITVISGKLFEVYLPHWICIVEHSSEEMHGVASITTTKERLLKMLEDLGQEEFNRFKWFLQYSEVLAGLPRISCSQLENSNILDLVDLMSQTYSQKSLEVTKKIFQKINRNDLVQKLSDIGSGSKETQWMNTDPESEQGDIFLVLNKLSFSARWMKMIITIAIF